MTLVRPIVSHTCVESLSTIKSPLVMAHIYIIPVYPVARPFSVGTSGPERHGHCLTLSLKHPIVAPWLSSHSSWLTMPLIPCFSTRYFRCFFSRLPILFPDRLPPPRPSFPNYSDMQNSSMTATHRLLTLLQNAIGHSSTSQ